MEQHSRGEFLKKAAILAASVILGGCNKNDDDTSNNGLKSGQVEFKARRNNRGEIAFLAIAKKISIDWGDGTKEDFFPNGVSKLYAHNYNDDNIQTVSVMTESLTSIIL